MWFVFSSEYCSDLLDEADNLAAAAAVVAILALHPPDDVGLRLSAGCGRDSYCPFFLSIFFVSCLVFFFCFFFVFSFFSLVGPSPGMYAAAGCGSSLF